MCRVAKAQLAFDCRIGRTEQLKSRGARHGDHTPRLWMCQEAPCFTLKTEIFAQAAPISAVDILDEHRKDAWPAPAQPFLHGLGEAPVHRLADLVNATGSPSNHKHASPVGNDR